MVLFLFLFCYFGEMVTTRSLAIADSAWDSLWYLYPMEQQRYLKLTIGFSHIDFHFSGLGLMYCTMASFSGVSYFPFVMLEVFYENHVLTMCHGPITPDLLRRNKILVKFLVTLFTRLDTSHEEIMFQIPYIYSFSSYS